MIQQAIDSRDESEALCSKSPPIWQRAVFVNSKTTGNIADTGLKVKGETAARWMSVAQCFAGLPEQPPVPGTRFTIIRESTGSRP